MTRSATKRRPAARAAVSTRRDSARRSEPPSARELWLAGLGAAAATREAATDFVDLLVAKGRETEPRVRASANRALSSVRQESRRVAEKVVDELGVRAKGAIEGALERLGVAPRKRAKNVLHRLGDLAEAIL